MIPDLRFLARRKTLTVVAILTMALALGANTTALSVVQAFLFSSLGVPEPERVVLIAPTRDLPGRGAVVFSEAYPNYDLLRRTQRTFAGVTVFLQVQASWDDHGEARSLNAARVSPSFFPTMRVRPVIGRAFTADEVGPSPPNVVIISDALWRSEFKRDAGAIGRTMSINGAPQTIIGVMPETFAQPLPTDVWLPFDIPASQWTSITGARQLTVYARLADGATMETAAADVKRFEALAIQTSPADNKDYRYELQTLRDVLLSGAGSSALFVQIGAATLLILAILNLASLLIAWGFERRQEMALRVALGAVGTQVTRLLVQQSLVIVGAGFLVGTGFAYGALRTLQQFDLGSTVGVLVAAAHIDWKVLVITSGIAVLSGLLAGALPAWFGRHANLAQTLRASSRSATLSREAVRWQKIMVIGQAGLSTTIVAAAILLGVSFRRLMEVPGGFSGGGQIVARIVLPDDRYGKHPQRAAFAARLMANLAQEPEIAKAGFSTTLPVGDGTWGARFFIELPDGTRPPEPTLFHFRRVSPGYLDVMGISLVRGRTFTASDDSASLPVVVVSQALAERSWPGQEPIGKRLLRFVSSGAEPAPYTVVGVVGNTQDAGYTAPAGDAVYIPFAQVSATRMSIVVEPRSAQGAAALVALKRALRNTDPVIAPSGVTTVQDLVGSANALPRLRMLVLTVFAIVALGIVLLGSYGVMTQLVSNRERELAVRMVFGASPGRLGASIVGQSARLMTAGVAVGLAVVWIAGGTLSAFIFGIQSRSASVLGVAAGILFVVGLAATVPAALRAMRVDIRLGI